MAQVLSPGAVPDPEPRMDLQDEEWRENLNVRMICKECREDPPNLYEDRQSGDLLCASCGLVLQQRSVDQSSEWRTFSNDDQNNDDPSRVGDGPNALLNGAQLSTSISFGDGGIKGKELSRANNKSNADKGNKLLLQAYKQISALCDSIQLPGSVADTAKHLYKDAEESRVFKGKSQEVLIAGCVFLACRRNGVTRTFREVMDLTKVSKKEIGRTFKLLEGFLIGRDKERTTQNAVISGGVVVQNEKYQSTDSANAADLCARFCSMLDFTPTAISVSTKLAENMMAIGALAGRSPLSQAAAVIFMTGHLMKQSKTPKEIHQVAKVSDSTIRGAYRLLYNVRERVVDEVMISKGADVENLPKPT